MEATNHLLREVSSFLSHSHSFGLEEESHDLTDGWDKSLAIPSLVFQFMWSSALQQTTRQGIDIVSEITVLQSGLKMIAARAQTSAFEASPYLRD